MPVRHRLGLSRAGGGEGPQLTPCPDDRFLPANQSGLLGFSSPGDGAGEAAADLMASAFAYLQSQFLGPSIHAGVARSGGCSVPSVATAVVPAAAAQG